ncbi:hypothetical protein N1031_08455 [Herbiconiux moechotypicola]|uniref:Sporulation protein YtfJ n=1 Tax=Herbiconiux moechotypicola TaxID=637393 RepID=A0ABP5QGH0_9MICO|nr:hypothetical protein [Herbiconiux moechotypicola]MCS5729791.1 hypothetical protein [Herbiconiux moechotypicola]
MADLVETLSDATRSIGVNAAYGAPVEIDGATFVPVALVWAGFGGGNGKASSPGATDKKIGAGDAGGEGFGGGGVSIPIGAYVSGPDGKAAFEPNLIALLAVSIPVICTTGWALARFVRALKK